MNAPVDPFKGLAHYEKEMQRTELYQDILKQLQHKQEAYDDSAIGHSFVNHYEQQLPGIITAVTGDHSFLNSDSETNRRVIMEAVDGGMALKAGLVAAVLMIVYKIIRVMTNNPAFGAGGGGGGGGGRGTVPYVKEKQNELATKAKELKSLLNEAKDAVKVVKGNAVARDETSPQYEAAEKVNSSFRVYVQSGDGPITPKEEAKTESDDPFKTIEQMDLAAIGFGNLPAFMMLKKREHFTDVISVINMVLKALGYFDPAKLSDMVEQVSSKLNEPKDAEFLLSDSYNSMINELVRRISGALGLEGNIDPASMTRLEVNPELKEQYEGVVRTSYGKVMQEKDEDVIRLEDFIMDYVKEDGEFAYRSTVLAEFNADFAEFLGSNRELEDSRYYSGLQLYATKLTEFKQMVKQSTDLSNKDVIIRRLDMLTSIIETYTKFLLAMLCIFRKEADKVDTFRENNIEKMNKLAKALQDFVNKAKGETA